MDIADIHRRLSPTVFRLSPTAVSYIADNEEAQSLLYQGIEPYSLPVNTRARINFFLTKNNLLTTKRAG